MGLTDNPQLEAILEFIKQNEQENPAQLLLSKQIPAAFPKQAIAEQIAARKKAKSKLPSLYRNSKLIFPPAVSMEQCSSEATALFKASLIKGTTLTDLTGGFGIDTLFLSVNFEETSYVEQNEQLCTLAEYNFQLLNRVDISVYHDDALKFLAHMPKGDCIYIDPARRDKNNQKVFGWEDCQPDIKTNLAVLLAKSNTVLAKAAPMLDLSQAVSDLSNTVSNIYIVEWKEEVRELLFLIDGANNPNPQIHAISLSDNGKIKKQLVGDFETERRLSSETSMPLKYLYEPSPSAMKSGLFNTIAKKYGLKKLHINTQLFTSNEIEEEFPGKVYEVEASISAQKKALKKHLPEMKVNLKSRNFPMPINDLKKKLGIKDGGNKYLFAVTLADAQKSLLLCNKINN